MKQDEFMQLPIAERGLHVMNQGKLLTQVRQKDHLLSLYTVNDFFVEVFYSIKTNQIENIDIINDFSRIDLYIDESAKKEKLHLN